MAQTIYLNMIPTGITPRVHLSQYDVGESINFVLAYGAVEYTVPTGATVKVQGTKPSGFGYTVNATFTGNVASITVTEDMTGEAGNVASELVVTKDGNILGSKNFIVEVEKTPHAHGIIDGNAEEVMPELTQLVERVEDAASSVLDRQTVTNTLPAGSQATYSFDEDTNTQTFGIPQGEAGAGATDVTASAYSSSKTYAVGDYVIHNGYLYRCTTAITTAESFTAGHWTQVVLADDVTDLKSDLSYAEGLFLDEVDFIYDENDGYYINSVGTLSKDNSTHTTNLVEIPSGTKRIYFHNVVPENGFYCFAFYSGSTVSSSTAVSKYAYTPSNASDYYVEIPIGAKYFLYSHLASDVAGNVYFVKDDFIENLEPSQTTFFENKNLFDIMADNLIGSYYNESNVLVTNANYGQTALIPVEEGERYTSAETGYFVLWYDANNSYLGNTSSITFNSQKYADAIAGSAYARFMFTVADIDSFYVKCTSKEVAVFKSEYLPNMSESEDTNPYKNSQGVAFGTSLTYKALTTGGYLQYLPTLSGITFDNQGVGSSAILNPSGSLNMLEKIKGYTDYASKDIVIIEGFVNDWYGQKSLGTYTDTSEDTVCGCLRSAINYVFSQNANVTLFIILDHYGRNYNGTDESSTAIRNGKTQYEFYEEMAKVCESLAVKVIKLYAMSEMSENTPQYFLDDIHPNALGAKQTANAIWSVMKQHFPNQK